MASKRKGKPVTDILSKASQALAKSRQLRDSGKANPTSAFQKGIPTQKKAGATNSRVISAKANYSSSDDDIDELDILASKSPSTFLEALDKYIAGMKSSRKAKSVTVSNYVRDSDLSVISSGTPSITLTSISGQGSSHISKLKKMTSATPTKDGIQLAKETTVSYSGKRSKQPGDFPATSDVGNNIGGNELARRETEEKFEPLRLASSGLPANTYSDNNINDTAGHPHETVAALMKRGDKVSEETYKVLQMMVKGSEAADAAFPNERKDKSVATESIIDENVLKTDASISVALEEDDIEEEEIPISAVSENITYVGETMEDIVENLMSLDLEVENKIEAEHQTIGAEVFDFKVTNLNTSRSIVAEEENSNLDEEEEEESEEVTLKDFTYESDFELDQKSSVSRKSGVGKDSLQEDDNESNNFQEFIKSVNESNSIKEKSVTFTKESKPASVSEEKISVSKNITISRSEKASLISPSQKSTRSSGKDAQSIFSKSGSVSPSLSPENENSRSNSKSQDKSFIVPVQPVGAPSTNTNVTSSQAYKMTSSRTKPSPSRTTEKSHSKVKVQEMYTSAPKSQRVVSRSEFKDDEVETMQKLKSSRKLMERSKPDIASKSRIMRSPKNPVNDLMNIDGEISTRHREHVTREQIKAESTRKKNAANKEKRGEYLQFLQFKEPKVTEALLPEVMEWYKMNNRKNFPHTSSFNKNEPGTSSRAYEISQMMAMMDKLNDTVTPAFKRTHSTKPRESVNYGAPYFTRSGDFAEGNFQPPEKIQIPELVRDVLDSHHRMYTMTINAAKRMGKKSKELVKEQDKQERKNRPSATSGLKKPAKA